MEKLEKLYEGKAKQLYATDDPEVLWVEYKNSATAGDGEKKEDFAGKGRLNNLITTLIFDLLKKRGIDSHLVARVGETSQLVKKVTMFPLEIVLRNTAAAKIDVKLVDFKIEMGRTSDGTLLLADEITPDSCRLWDQRDHSGKVEHLDKDLFRRDLGDIIPAYEEIESRLAGLAKSEGIEVAE